jgi:enhancing lycopene biosynthesis protein 2
VRPEVRSFLEAFFAAAKPVGAICIAPALVAMTLAGRDRRPSLTLGADPGVAAAIETLGARHRTVGSAREIIVDDACNLVTTAAYMFDDARLSDVWIGIERCVAEVLRRVE